MHDDCNIDDREAVAERLKGFGSATLHEAQGQKGAMCGGIRPLDPALRLAGRALTVEAKAGDNLIVHHALTLAGPGDVLVVDVKGYAGAGVWGDILTLAAMKRGVAGLVIDGAVRDSQAIVEMGFPVFARGISINAAQKNQPGRANVPIVCGGVRVDPGDWIVGDRDGIVVIARDDLGRAMRGAVRREDLENQVRRRIEEGASTVEILHLEDSLSKAGICVDARLV
jgi:4-hydroxy-4-methyl-2-oxoglutarate aldolase